MDFNKRYVVLGRKRKHKMWILEYQTNSYFIAFILKLYLLGKYDYVEIRKE